MYEYKYYRGSGLSRESVSFEAPDRFYGKTDVVIDVGLLIDGIKSFPCGSGDDWTLTLKQRLDILKAVRDGRKPYTEAALKTADGWHNSGIGTFGDYCKPGDLVDEGIVNHFVNSVPPHLMWESCTQAGEPYSHERDPETGKYRATWTTFHREGPDTWRFDGECFSRENIHRAGELSRLERAIEETRREIFETRKRLNSICEKCSRLDESCDGTTNQTWTGCTRRELKA